MGDGTQMCCIVRNGQEAKFELRGGISRPRRADSIVPEAEGMLVCKGLCAGLQKRPKFHAVSPNYSDGLS